MDLEEFDTEYRTLDLRSELSAENLLRTLDQLWYIPATRAARWMDLIGDYAGTEPFVIDGESLFQMVLDDPLLAIGRDDECSFQILHAYETVERILMEFTTRSANFEIVFFHANRHLTLRTGETPFLVASRFLARTLLFEHLLKLDYPIHTFEDLVDSEWREYEAIKKPMFIMINDGGLPEVGKGCSVKYLLCQRRFIYEILRSQIPIALLKGAEYCDSKILSFVYEPKSNRQSLTTQPAVSRILSIIAKDLDKELRNYAPSSDQRLQELPAPTNPVLKTQLEFTGKLSERLLRESVSPINRELVYLTIHHFLFLPKLSVRERAQPYTDLGETFTQHLITHFLPSLFFNSADLIRTSGYGSFDFDGRVFLSTTAFILTQDSSHMEHLVDPEVYSQLNGIWSYLGNPGPCCLDRLRSLACPPTSQLVKSPPRKTLKLMAFDNPVFNEHLSAVRVPVHDVDESNQVSLHLEFGGTLFSDTQHWHNQKSILPSHLGGAPAKPTDARSKFRIQRSVQRFMANLQMQAATISGASGSSLRQITIPAVGPSSSKAPPSRISTDHRRDNQNTGKARKLTSKEKTLQQIQKQKMIEEQKESREWWEKTLASLAGQTIIQQISDLTPLFRNKRAQEKRMSLEMNLYRLHLEISQWIAEQDPSAADIHDKFSVSIIRIVKAICDKRVMTLSAEKIITTILTIMGFKQYITGLLGKTEMTEDDASSFKFVRLVKKKSDVPLHPFMMIREHPVDWQLRLFGEFMDRSMESAPDPRVAFEPDAWQRRVLDCIDKNHSILVVAPTSAGKTFISYYAMEQVLRSSDDGILVYVAPTKALVTQIAAEVYARFSKKLTGKSCWAIHTRDYRIHDPQKCQILVTVPEVLATMLLSPALARTWTPNIKRIILDEIHSIGQQDGGAVWEQIVLLAPCPVIGLSATIGSPETFNNWLKSVQEAHGFEHDFIEHPHRYSHLRKFFYTITAGESFNNLDEHQPTSRLRFLHPASVLAFGRSTIPKDLALEARDVLSLFHALRKVKSVQQKLEELDPRIFFESSDNLLRQKDVLKYEHELKAILADVLETSDRQDESSPALEVIKDLQDPVLRRLPPEKLNAPPSRELFKDNLIILLADLHSQGELPAILFNFDRRDCEIMAQTLCSSLKNAEDDWKLSSQKWQKKLDEWELWKLNTKSRERAMERTKKMKKDEDEPMDRSSGASWEASFDPELPLPQFSFVARKSTFSMSQLEEEIQSLWWTTIPKWTYEGLRRGIGVHHAGMNKAYRSLVESLFRRGFLRVVIATGTLALGINAPAKTSVFCGDSPFLTALMYRQCAGRAGRRGYDLLGNVIFYGLPMDRVQRLILSKLPSLGGGFPMTSTLVLRLFNILKGSDNAPVAVNAIRSLLSLPQVTFASNIGRDHLLHHLRFSIEYLRQSRLLSQSGEPMNLFAIAGHLYYTEPSNLALVALLRNGVLHEICKDSNFERARRGYILLMCHLFGRRNISQIFTNESNIKELRSKYPSSIILPDMPERAKLLLSHHNEEILRIFVGYAVAFANEHSESLGSASKLPLSGMEYCGQDSDDPLSRSLRNTSIPLVARSAFVANSGHDDEFKTVEELARTARSGIYLNAHAIPSLEHLTNEGMFEHKLNAYLLDFYVHGQTQAIIKANGIRGGDIWYLLQDFALTLMTVKAALQQLLQKASKETLERQSREEGQNSNGYDSYDQIDFDEDDGATDASLGGTGSGGEVENEEDFKRPLGVSDADWMVYRVVGAACGEFYLKFKGMWA